MESSLVWNKSADGGDDQLGHNFWNFLTTKPDSEAIYREEEGDVESGAIDARLCNDFRGMITVEEIEVEDDIGNGFHDESDGTTETGDEVVGDHIRKGFDQDYNSHIQVPKYCYDAQIPHGLPTYHSYFYQTDHNSQPSNDTTGFIQATLDGDLSAMKELVGAHNREALTIEGFEEGGTALHQTLRYGTYREHIAEWLVKQMTGEDLEILDKEGYTPLGLATRHRFSISLLKCMMIKNPNLPNIGRSKRIPVVVASWAGFAEETILLYKETDPQILSLLHLNTCDVTEKNINNFRESHPDIALDQDITARLTGTAAVHLLTQCISISLFDIATDLVVESPEILYRFDDDKISPIHALAKRMSVLRSLTQPNKSGDMNTAVREAKENKALFDEALKFLRLLCEGAQPGNIKEWCQISEAMIEATKHGNIEFITVMLEAVPELINAVERGMYIFWVAVENRQENVFNLIYDVKQKDLQLSLLVEHDNILHCAAKLPHSTVLDRISDGPAYLQIQREVQWFQAVQEVAIPKYRHEQNGQGLTPSALFTKSHAKLLKAGEESLKETAKAATVVGSLMVTTMFAAAFAVIAGTNDIHNHSVLNKVLLGIFILLDAMSLFWSASSIIVFLGILASRYSYEAYLISLPRKFITGFIALFWSITSMALAFSCGLFLMIQGGRFAFIILPIILFSLLPVYYFFTSMFPLLRTIRKSTNQIIFDKDTKLPSTRNREDDHFC